MTGLTIEQRQEKLRLLIIDILRHKNRATAREIMYELQAHDIWKRPREISGIILGDYELKKQVDIEYRNVGGLTFTLKSDIASILRR